MNQLEALRSVDFDKLVGLKANLYYNNNAQTFQLGDVTFEVIEDPDDGYRSYFREVQIINMNSEKKPGNLLGGVIIEAANHGDFGGYRITDELDGHVWLEFGTDHSDSYYPCFIYNFTPKASKV
jgi:hypothetical protein